MDEWNTEELIEADKRFVWHPFTDMREWCAPEHEPLVLVEGRGALLRDSKGREYIDGNSSIWTNIHGHNHPHINAAIRRQLVAELKAKAWAPAVDVSVSKGRVILTGAIFDDRQRDAIRVLVENTAGVKGIDDQLVWIDPTSGMVIGPQAA